MSSSAEFLQSNSVFVLQNEVDYLDDLGEQVTNEVSANRGLVRAAPLHPGREARFAGRGQPALAARFSLVRGLSFPPRQGIFWAANQVYT